MRGLFAGADYVHQHWTDLDRTRRPERADAVRSHGDRARPGRVAAANATRPDRAGQRRRAQRQRADEPRRSPITTGCRRRSATAAARSSRRRSATRCRRRPTRPSPTATASARTTRTSRASAKRSAARASSISGIARCITASYDAAVQHHRRHADAVRVGAAVQRRPPASTTTATARTTTGRSSTAR